MIEIVKELPQIPDPPAQRGPGDNRKDCCRAKENMEYYHYDENTGARAFRCKICGCRHFVMDAEPGRLGLIR
jgi:hypothetical protein